MDTKISVLFAYAYQSVSVFCVVCLVTDKKKTKQNRGLVMSFNSMTDFLMLVACVDLMMFFWRYFDRCFQVTPSRERRGPRGVNNSSTEINGK